MDLAGIHNLFAKLLKPFSELVGHMYLAPKARAIRSYHIRQMLDHLEPGDVVLAMGYGEMTNLFIEGQYKHAAMYVGAGKVIEAVGEGVRTALFEDFCACKDRIGIYRQKFCTEDQVVAAVHYALDQVGKAYDYEFEPSDKTFYCAELVEYSYQRALDFKSPFVVREIMGVLTVLPDDFKLAKDKFETVLELPGAA